MQATGREESLPQVEEFKLHGVRENGRGDSQIEVAFTAMCLSFWSVVVKTEISNKATLSIPTLTYGHELVWAITKRIRSQKQAVKTGF